MRVAHFIHRYPPALGGAEAYFARLSRHLADQGEGVEVFTSNALDLEAFWSAQARRLPAGAKQDGNVVVHRHALRHWPGQRYLLKLLSLLPSPPLQTLTVSCNPVLPGMWAASGQRRGFDVVHASAFPYAFPIMCALRLARRCSAPFLLTPFLHLGDERSRRAYLSPAMIYLLRAADRVFVQTMVERDAILGEGIPSERLILLGMGVDPEECTGGDRPRSRERLGIGPDEVVIGHLANQSVEKGTVDLLLAAERLWQAGVSLRVLLAGPEMPNFLSFWKEFAARLRARSASKGDGAHLLGLRAPQGIQGIRAPQGIRVTRLGVLSDDQKRDFYAALDLFALPSRSDSFGLVFLEAWANRVPCVAYRAGGVAEVVRHGTDGLLAEAGNLDELTVALHRLIADRELRLQLGEAGRNRALRDHAWEPRLGLVQQIYEDCLRGRRSRIP